MMKKQLTLLLALTTLFLLSAPLKAEGNWYYDEATSKWRKNITPKFLLFNEVTQAELRENVMISGGASPTAPSAETLTDGYYIISGGQIGTTTTPEQLRQGHVLVPNPDNSSETVLRLASRGTTSVSGGVLGVAGYLNLHWYVPSKFNRKTYTVESKFEIYDASANTITFALYGPGGGSSPRPSSTSPGWRTFTDTYDPAVGGFVPFRYTIGFAGAWGNNKDNVAYFKTPVMEYVSTEAPVTRAVAVTTQGHGTVTPLHEKLYDQDVQQFTILSKVGGTLISAEYDGLDILSEIDENGVWYTPLLTANNHQLNVVFSTPISTDLSASVVDGWFTVVQGNDLTMLNLQQGTPISIYAATGKLVAHFVATSNQIVHTLSQGVYVVKAANKTVKVIIL